MSSYTYTIKSNPNFDKALCATSPPFHAPIPYLLQAQLGLDIVTFHFAGQRSCKVCELPGICQGSLIHEDVAGTLAICEVTNYTKFTIFY